MRVVRVRLNAYVVIAASHNARPNKPHTTRSRQNHAIFFRGNVKKAFDFDRYGSLDKIELHLFPEFICDSISSGILS